jgi:hypothetical protein
MFLGRIGIQVFFQQRGNRKEIKAMDAWVNRVLYLEIKRTFFSKSRAKKISITCSALRARNRNSISALEAYGGY